MNFEIDLNRVELAELEKQAARHDCTQEQYVTACVLSDMRLHGRLNARFPNEQISAAKMPSEVRGGTAL